MHSKNIMHRDIKPENIILEKINNLTTLKIVDFGLATYSNLKKYKIIYLIDLNFQNVELQDMQLLKQLI